jgi:hypothetical protein
MPRDRYPDKIQRWEREEEIWHDGYRRGYQAAQLEFVTEISPQWGMHTRSDVVKRVERKKKRKLSDWNKFVKANSKKKQFRYASGKVNLKKLGVAYRKKKRGR